MVAVTSPVNLSDTSLICHCSKGLLGEGASKPFLNSQAATLCSIFTNCTFQSALFPLLKPQNAYLAIPLITQDPIPYPYSITAHKICHNDICTQSIAHHSNLIRSCDSRLWIVEKIIHDFCSTSRLLGTVRKYWNPGVDGE